MNYKKQKRKQNYKKTIWINWKRALIRKQNESNKEINQTEKKQKREKNEMTLLKWVEFSN